MAEAAVQHGWGRLRSRRPLTARDRSLAAALVVAALLRAAWIVVATRSSSDPFSDASEFLRLADGFARGDLPTWDTGLPTAWLGPGYPLLLTPLALVSRATDGVSLVFLAAMVNAVAGVVTVAASAFLAARWLGPGTRNPTAWIMAVAPAQIYFTSTAHSEVAFGALCLLACCVLTVIVQRDPVSGERTTPWVLAGVLIGFAMLTRTQGIVLLAVPMLAVRAWRGSWRGALRATALVVAGSLVLLVPWTVRNVVQVGVWTYGSTGNAVTLCLGNHDDAVAEYRNEELSRRIREDCYRYSVYDDPELGAAPSWWRYEHPDEWRWYRQTIRRGVGWAVTHPVEEVDLVLRKEVELWRDDTEAVGAARNFASRTWAGPATAPLEWAANVWLWAVEVLAVVALVRLRRCRQAVPIWGMVALLNATVVFAVTFPHYRFAAVPFVAILAGAQVASMLGRSVAPREPSLPAGVGVTPD